MTYSIVYNSKTGNTRALAETIRDFLPKEDCVYFGQPDQMALTADRVYVGFWTDKGDCTIETTNFLAQITTQTVFLFGTAGFGGSAEYFNTILSAVERHLPSPDSVVGTFMCQGKMPSSVRARYESMEESPRKQMMLENYDRALNHPNNADLENLKAALQKAE